MSQIRDEKLYRQTHGRFEAYCKERWRFTRMRASQLIKAADVSVNVNHGLQNERHARELARLPVSEQADCWQEYVEECEADEVKLTAKGLREKVGERLKSVQCDDDAEPTDAPEETFELDEAEDDLPESDEPDPTPNARRQPCE